MTAETNPTDLILPSTTGYQTLGRKTFVIFFLDRIQIAMIFLLIAIGLFAVGPQPFVAKVPVPNLASYLLLAAWIALAVFAVAIAIALLVSWIIYVNFKFFLDEDSLRIKSGVFSKEEIAMPYRQIQNVDIERDLTYQMLGMSRLVILTAGREDEAKPGENESEGVLPALDKGLAEQLQKELLKRTNVEKVIEEKP